MCHDMLFLLLYYLYVFDCLLPTCLTTYIRLFSTLYTMYACFTSSVVTVKLHCIS
jgi:hypothetical protein